MLRSRSLTFIFLPVSLQSWLKYKNIWQGLSVGEHIYCVLFYSTNLYFLHPNVIQGLWAWINSLRSSDAVWHGSVLAQVLACCLMAPNHYLNQCWLMIYIYKIFGKLVSCRTYILSDMLYLKFTWTNADLSSKVFLGIHIRTISQVFMNLVCKYYLFRDYTFKINNTSSHWVNSLGPSDAIWQHKSGSTLAQVMVCCQMALAPGKFEWYFKYVIFKQILVIDGWGISCEIALIWMPLDFTDDQSTLVQVMA